MIYLRPRIPVVLIVVAVSLCASVFAAIGQVEPMRHEVRAQSGSHASDAREHFSARSVGLPRLTHGASVESLDVLSQRLTLSLDAFYAGVVRGEQERAEQERIEELARVEAAKFRPVAFTPPVRSWESFAACVIAHESGGVADAQNRSSSASGAFQDLSNTWDYIGTLYPPAAQYAEAKDAPIEVQMEGNRQLWLVSGGSPWNGSGC